MTLKHPWPRPQWPLGAVLFAAGGLLSACTGDVGLAGVATPTAPGEPSTMPRPGGGGTGQLGTMAATPPATEAPAPKTGFTCARPADAGASPRTWRLSAAQYGRTVATLFSGRAKSGAETLAAPAGVSLPFGGINESDRFSTQARSYAVRVEELGDAIGAADQIARALFDHLATGSCLAMDAGFDRCIESLVRDKGALLFRRPLSSAEVTGYASLATGQAPTAGKRAATELAFKALLLAPQFLYRTELGAPNGGDPKRRRLTTYEIASALSYSLIDGPPDQALWDAAADGSLAGPAAITMHTRRLLAGSPPTLRRFVREYFRYPHAVDIAKAAKTHRPADLVKDTDALVDALLSRQAGQGFLTALLTSPLGFASKNTADVYGLTSTAADPEPVTFRQPERVSILAQPSWLAAYSQPERSDVVRRGRFVREHLLCASVPSIEIEDVAPIPTDTERTLREKMAAHVENPSCRGCHELLDPIGFAFEGFDHFGKLRTTEAGRPVNATGALVGSGDQDGTVDGVASLMQRLARSRTVTECFVSQTFQHFMGREPAAGDVCALSAAAKAYDEAGGDLRALVSAFYTSDAFLVRKL